LRYVIEVFMSLLAALSRGGAVIGAIFLIVALLQQLISVVGLLLALIKLAIIVVFVAVMIMIVVAIFSARRREKAERQET
jgi:hypothetical protein